VVSAPISIERAFEIGRNTYPRVELPLAAFTAFAQFRGETWGGNPERAADLYLACACVERLPAAVAEFVSEYGERIPSFLRRVSNDRDLVADVRQIIMLRCVIGEGARPPALTTYSATGSLEGWVRATAVREALALNRRTEREVANVAAVLEARATWVDREISLFKQMYREPVSQAFVDACAELPAEERALLRLHYVDGVTTANLANIYGISRATLIRRLATARESLVGRVKASLKRTAGVTEQDFDSVLRLVKSQLDLRLSVVLQEPKRPNL
jgi:RNA polymerase sigma-70 factor, ECF subfamily